MSELGPGEQPVLLSQAFDLANRETGLGVRELAQELAWPLARVRELLGLPDSGRCCDWCEYGPPVGTRVVGRGRSLGFDHGLVCRWGGLGAVCGLVGVSGEFGCDALTACEDGRGGGG